MTSGNEFRIELDEFRRHAPRLGQLGKQLEQDLKNLTVDLGEVTGAWGDDIFGSAFAQNYLPKAEQALQDIAKAALMFAHLEESSGAAADTLEAADEGLAGVLDKVRDTIEKNGINRGKA
ncbi:WXG100 family type VII secretion target [Nocardia africana]|uniref:WXG100 family type VII secretion target n=1 Tax=Nocardia africana TaxID=134964 RepID=A0A378WL48_9NOCA|nr:hypothetical protein [Nocardia africana]MCC3315709.1 hypothetical protein [Nocardia africana]SUA41978.1 Uncharacterised protein [Nocardia africana]